jgi:hypothetical protein
MAVCAVCSKHSYGRNVCATVIGCSSKSVSASSQCTHCHRNLASSYLGSWQYKSTKCRALQKLKLLAFKLAVSGSAVVRLNFFIEMVLNNAKSENYRE